MYTHQKGVLPFITSSLGILIPCTFFINALILLFPGFANSINSMPVEVVFIKIIQLMIGLALYLFFPVLFGIFFSGIFPSVRVTKDGLRYAYFGGLIQKGVKWDEIERLAELPWDITALVIDRPGLSAFNGLFMNEIYGKIARLRVPIILISNTTSTLNKSLQEIIQRSSNLSK